MTVVLKILYSSSCPFQAGGVVVNGSGHASDVQGVSPAPDGTSAARRHAGGARVVARVPAKGKWIEPSAISAGPLECLSVGLDHYLQH